jgi:5-formyltetrahydrofolate cyclo-ligase
MRSDKMARPFYLGIGFLEQLHLSIPMDVHDVMLDAIVSPDQTTL